jgi:hypothetical protein
LSVEAFNALGNNLTVPQDSVCSVYVLTNLTYFAWGVQIRENPVPLYAAMIEDLGQGDFVKVNCGARSHTWLAP